MSNDPNNPTIVDGEMFPALVYLYRPDGTHPGPIEVPDFTRLQGFSQRIRDHVLKGLQVVITDPLDRCVFHAANGKIIYPTESQREAARNA